MERCMPIGNLRGRVAMSRFVETRSAQPEARIARRAPSPDDRAGNADAGALAGGCGRLRPLFHDADSYFLIRAYDSLEDRQQSQDRFYGSEEWRQGPREPILVLIESYTSVGLEMDEATVQGLRR